jgi:acyl-CoA reductase-like NAD-dependent aldehyde dehydrogenase
MNHRRLLIHGEWVDTGTAFPVQNPYSGEEIAQVCLGDTKTIEAAITSARSAFAEVRHGAAHKKSSVLSATARAMEARKQEFIDTIVAEAGKPVTFAEAEVNRAIMTFTAAAEEARRQNGEVLDMDAFGTGDGHIGYTRRFPIGVIAGITPFNFPLNLVAHKVAPALATGNCIIVKPAPKCPLTALLLGEVLMEAGVPAGQVNVITCTNEHVSALVEDERIAMLSFTGSPAVGWPLKAKAGKKKVVLELGGNAAVIVHEDADLPAIIPIIANGGFAYAGQTCISVQRILVHTSIYDAFRTQFAAYVREHVKAGDPRERATVIGPMISAAAADRIRTLLENAQTAGGKFVLHASGEGANLGPIIMEDVPTSEAACRTELFAPVVVLGRYRDFAEALRMANDSSFGLQTGIFTRDIRLALQAHEQLDVGAVLINQVPTFRVENMPYGGVKDSGFGREGIRYAMEDMTEPRALIIRK